jgi:hypothetical protein
MTWKNEKMPDRDDGGDAAKQGKGPSKIDVKTNVHLDIRKSNAMQVKE